MNNDDNDLERDPYDHRIAGERLDLFHFQEEAPGMVFWHPRGLALYRVLEGAVRAQCRAHGYAEVKTPQIMRRAVWEASGHWAHFQEGMFRIDDPSCEAAIKPVSCPGHIYLFKHGLVSYRDLPMRLAELGVVHRDEPSGTLHGLMRVRQFTQDDGHVFAAEEDVEDEVLRFCESVPSFYRAFGFDDVRVAYSSRPASRAGDDAAWDRAEAALTAVLSRLGLDFVHQPGAGAFYGPKLEFVLHDRHGRQWQCGTIQVDLVMSERFDISYVARGGERRRPAMIHRALYGSLERFLGILLEHHGAALPPWLAPSQVVVLPVGAEHEDGARSLVRCLRSAGLRVDHDADDSLSRRIAAAHESAVPFVAILGERELSAGSVTVRAGKASVSLPVEEAVQHLVERCALPTRSTH
jgi:threonyl-tRNA synthetase